MNRREFCLTGFAGAAAWNHSAALSAAEAAPAQTAVAGELLYNGIRLPAAWPPHGSNGTLHLPSTPPYLTNPPAVVPIDVGRQLFVDDFLIERCTLKRTFHLPEYHPGGAVVRPDRP